MATPSCFACRDAYDGGQHAPMLYDTCGHAICLKCIEALRTLPPQFHSCSICKEPVNLAQVSPNVALQEALGHVGINGGHSNNSSNHNHNDVSAEVGADVDTEGDAARPTNGARGASPVDVDGQLPPQMPMCEVHGRELVLWCVDHGFLGCGACFREPPHEECDRYMLEQARKNLEQELSRVLEQMRECGMRLKSVEERVAVRTDTLHSRRDKFEREVMQFFDEYINEVMMRRAALLEESRSCWDGLEATLKFERDYARQGLTFLADRYEEVSQLRRKPTVGFLRGCPALVTSLHTAVHEAKATLPEVEARFGRLPDPSFSSPAASVYRQSLDAIAVQAKLPPQLQLQQAGVDTLTPQLDSLSIAESPQGFNGSQASPMHQQQQRPLSVPPGLSPLVVGSPHSPAMRPSPSIESPSASPGVHPAAASHQPTTTEQKPMSWARAAAQKPATPPATVVAKSPKPRAPPPPTAKKEAKAGKGNKDKPGNQGAPKGKDRSGEKPKWHKRFPGVPHAKSEEPGRTEAIVDNVANAGNDGFLHFVSPSGVLMAVYYNVHGKVGTTNPDHIDPKTIKKGQRMIVELKENPYGHLIVNKPERRWVAASIRRAGGK